MLEAMSSHPPARLLWLSAFLDTAYLDEAKFLKC